MRLVCPNCGAQYEVDDRVIPLNGRDVQCSNCGHTWFQRPAGAEGDLIEPEDQADKAGAQSVTQDTAPEPAPEPEVEPESSPQETQAGAPEKIPEPGPEQTPEITPEPNQGPQARRTLDDNLQEVLREEAEREARVRARVRQKIETQEDLGLETPAVTGSDQRAVAAQERMARLRGLDVEEDTTTSGGAGTRRDLLPDIEEINSSLTSIGSAEIIDDFAEPAKRGGFSRGFVLVVLLALIAVAIYLYAPLIGEKVPALAGPLENYVELVDKARLWIDDMVALALSKLQ